MWSPPARGTFCGLDNKQPTDALGVSDTQNSREHEISLKGTSGALGKRGGVLQEREWWVGSVTVLTRAETCGGQRSLSVPSLGQSRGPSGVRQLLRGLGTFLNLLSLQCLGGLSEP